MVGVEDAHKVLADRYWDLVQDNTVNKVSFVYVLQEEHKRSGFSYARPEWMHLRKNEWTIENQNIDKNNRWQT